MTIDTLELPEQPSKRPRFNRVDLWICLAIACAAFALYYQVRHFDFVDFDDHQDVVDNPHIRAGFSPAALKWALTSGQDANWFPLTRLSHLADYRIFGLASGAHHLVNLFFHVLASLLLFIFLRRAAGARWPAAFVAFVFALHPLHAESVAWVAERKDVLCAFFWFLTLCAWILYAEHPALRRYMLALTPFALGLMAKPMIVTLPAVLFLLDLWPLRRRLSARSRILEKLPFFALSAAASVVTFVAQRNGRAVQSLERFPPGLRIENALVTAVVYIVKMFWPTGLAAFYPYPASIPFWQVAVSLTALAAVSYAVIRARRAHSFLAVGWFWYLGTLAPVIGLIQVGEQARADRYMYIPMVGLAIMLAWGAAALPDRWHKACAGFGVAACVAMAAVAWPQIGYWRGTEPLFRHAINVTTGNYLAYGNLAVAIAADPSRLPEAVAILEQAVRIDPNYASAHNDLGDEFWAMGRSSDAVAQYREALRLDPAYAQAHSNLGFALTALGQLPEALVHCETAVKLVPSDRAARTNFGNALLQSGRSEEAIEQYNAALRIDPASAETHNSLGVALSRLPGHAFDALEHLEEAVRLRPTYVPAQTNLGTALLQIPGRRAEAVAHLEAAYRVRPDPALRRTLDSLRSAGSAAQP